MSGAGSDFTTQFYHHLRPDLTRLCIALARCIAAEVETFGDAWDALYAFARQRGASFLPDAAQDELREWLATALLDAVVEAEAAGWGEWHARNNIAPGGRL